MKLGKKAKKWLTFNQGFCTVVFNKGERENLRPSLVNQNKGKKMKKILLTSVASLAIAGVANAATTLESAVEGTIVGTNGTATIFNEEDGGGAKFVNTDGTESFVGVNDGGENGLVAQIYADKMNGDGKWEGAKIDVTNHGIYYTVGSDSFENRAVAANEIATVGAVTEGITQLINTKEALLSKDIGYNLGNPDGEEDGLVAKLDALTGAEGEDVSLVGAINLNSAAIANNAGKIETLTEAISASNTKLQNDVFALDSKVNELDENLSAGIASSVALSSVAVANVQKGEMSVGGGYGNYNSKSAMAFGAALGITDNWSANAGVGFGFGKDTKASVRVGTNYKFKLF